MTQKDNLAVPIARDEMGEAAFEHVVTPDELSNHLNQRKDVRAF